MKQQSGDEIRVTGDE